MKYNVVYILHTDGPEYRVAYLEDADTVYAGIDDQGKWIPNRKIIRTTFGKSIRHLHLSDALEEAKMIASDIFYLENGISILDDFKLHSFYELIF